MGLKNIITGWVTTLIGFCIMVMAILDFFDIIQVPAPEGMSKTTQLGIAFFVGFALFIVKPGFFEQKIIQVINKKVKDIN